MLEDLVIDTNVMMHADDPREARRADAELLLQKLLSSDTHICVDEGFNMDEALNRSCIGREYITHVVQGMLAYAIISEMAQSGKVKIISKKVNQQVSKKIAQQGIKGCDAIFIKVACNSKEKTLVSHDMNDIPISVRKRLNTEIKTEILEAKEVLGRL